MLKGLSILIVLVAIGAGCNSEPDGKAKPDKNSKAPPKPEEKSVLVELHEVQRGKIEELLERSAALEAEAQVQVLARTQNPAIELLVEEGDAVNAGQVLLRLENDRQQTAFNQARFQFENNKIEFARQKKLHEQLLISEADFQTTQLAYEQSKLQLENATRELEYTEVVAPIDGTITQRMVKVGDQVNTGTPIFEIIDLTSTIAVIHVPEQYLPKLQPNMDARISSGTFGEKVFDGFVKRISPIVEAQAGTVKVVIGVKELGPLRPGVWVDVELVLDSKEDAILIPKRSIVYDNDQTYAFKVYQDENGIRLARKSLVVPQNADKDHIEPTSGFEVGDQVIVAGQAGLKEDSPIRELEAIIDIADKTSPAKSSSSEKPGATKAPISK